MKDYILSRYVVLFSMDNLYLLFNSRNSAFLELNEKLYNDLCDLRDGKSFSVLDDKAITDQLLSMHILVTHDEDDDFLNQLLFEDSLDSFSTDTLNITFAPTLWCNLRCPYCFETSKSRGIVSTEVCDKIIDFIKKHKLSNSLNLSWYGGEPLIAISRIEYFLKRLSEEGINLVHHSITTNGTLFNEHALQVFEKYPLHSVQITLDGKKERHDKIRTHDDGHGSFDEILSNLDVFSKLFPKTNVSIRVNIGKHNTDDYAYLSQLIKERYDDKFYVYPGILQGDNDCGFTSHFFTDTEISDFFVHLIKNRMVTEIPHRQQKNCVATMLYGYVIGPKGELYKCWQDVGFKDKEIGSVLDGNFCNSALFHKYMLHGSFHNDMNCQRCKLLPTCDTGCARHRISNVYDKKGKRNLCTHFNLNDNESLKELLYMYYCNQKQNEHKNI